MITWSPALHIHRKLRSAFVTLCLAAAGTTAADAAPLVIHLTKAAGGALAMDAEIAGQKGLFLFDGGWGLSAVTPDMAKRIGCTPWGHTTGFRATGERIDSQQCQPAALVVDGQTYPLPTVAIVDLQKFMAPGSPVYAGGIGLDAFAGRVVTLRANAAEIVIEDDASLRKRLIRAHAIPVRLVRDSQGASLTVDAGIPTPKGTLWMELDTGNTGPSMVDKHVAELVGLQPDPALGQKLSVPIVPGVSLEGPVYVRDLILDGNIGMDFLGKWDLTLDLAHGRGWVSPARAHADE